MSEDGRRAAAELGRWAKQRSLMQGRHVPRRLRAVWNRRRTPVPR